MDNGASTEELVSCENAGIFRDEKWIVRGVDLKVKRGQILTLIGPNGSGKSTTAKMALGIQKPDEGRVTRLKGVRLAYVPQKIQIDWSLPMTVERFISLNSKVKINETDHALAQTDVRHLKHEQLSVLSGGEMQRVLLARALSRKPDILVLDEPVQGVDLNGELAIYDIIREQKNSNQCGILLVSHDLHFVMAETDEVICLNGHVCCHGTPSMVSENSEYQKLFGERATAALAFYRHDHDHTHLPDGRVQHADGSVTDHCHQNDGHHHAE